jgi:hypothetical protein
MKLITLTFFTFIRSVLLYLLFTLPIAGKPKIYFLSVVAAFVLGVVAWLVFMTFSFIIRVFKVPVTATYLLLYVAAFIAVLAAYSALLAYAVKGMHFWNIEWFTLYPLAAIIAGWISIYVNRRKLKNYFSPVKRVPLPVFYLHPDKFCLN